MSAAAADCVVAETTCWPCAADQVLRDAAQTLQCDVPFAVISKVAAPITAMVCRTLVKMPSTLSDLIGQYGVDGLDLARALEAASCMRAAAKWYRHAVDDPNETLAPSDRAEAALRLAMFAWDGLNSGITGEPDLSHTVPGMALFRCALLAEQDAFKMRGTGWRSPYIATTQLDAALYGSRVFPFQVVAADARRLNAEQVTVVSNAAHAGNPLAALAMARHTSLIQPAVPAGTIQHWLECAATLGSVHAQKALLLHYLFRTPATVANHDMAFQYAHALSLQRRLCWDLLNELFARAAKRVNHDAAYAALSAHCSRPS